MAPLTIAGYELDLDDPGLIMGHGGFGVVLKAREKGEVVALKVMVGSQTHIVDSARRERDMCQLLNPHANIVTLLSYRELPGADADARALIAAISRRLRMLTDDHVAQKHRLHQELEPNHPLLLLAYEVSGAAPWHPGQPWKSPAAAGPRHTDLPMCCARGQVLVGESMYDFVVSRFTPPPMSEVVPLFSQLISAMQHCHERSVAHLDLKLENVLIVDVSMPKRARPPTCTPRHAHWSGAAQPPTAAGCSRNPPTMPRSYRARAASCSLTLGWRAASLSRRRCASATRPARQPTLRRSAAPPPLPGPRCAPTTQAQHCASHGPPRHLCPATPL